jgi:putative GTP pyrophosphokinase
MEQKAADIFVKEFELKREFYKEFTLQLKSVIQNILDSENLKYFSVESRVKVSESLRQKILKSEKTIDKLTDIQDLAGIRIITYVYGDMNKIEKIIEENFDVQEKEEVEHRLGTDKMGYRSHHRIIRLSAQRLLLPEYKKFNEVVAELQICTILQHAWAQVEHDQIYKSNSILPEKIRRDFSLLAGMLEVSDNEFNRISGEIDIYQTSIDEHTQRGELDIPIDSISLRSYFDTRFKKIPSVESTFGPSDDMAEIVIEELKSFGIETLAQLDILIPKDYSEVFPSYKDELNYAGIARNVMLIDDPEKYFTKAWKNHWGGVTDKNRKLLEHYNVDMDVLKKYISIF